MQVGTSNCGPVFVRGVDYPPVGAKWATVPVLAGAVKRRLRGRWVDVEKHDIARMRSQTDNKFQAVLAGAAISGAGICVSNCSEHNAFKAILSRIFRPPRNRPQPGVWEWARQFVDALLPGFHAEPMSVEEWLASMPGRRRTALQKAWYEYQRTGWRPKYARFGAFVKREKLPDFEKRLGELIPMTEMTDRLIQGPSDHSHVIAGPVLKPLLHRLKEIWSKDNRLFYASTTLDKLQSWSDTHMRGAFTAFASDYSMFDNTHSRQSWGFMEALYRKAGCYRQAHFAEVMRAWRKPQGVACGKGWALRYKAPVMNASGRDDTALANAIINGFAAYLSSTAAFYQIPLMQLTVDLVRSCPVRLAVCGDDTLGFLPPLDAARRAAFQNDLSANLALFGLDAAGDKVVVTQEIERCVFLGMRPYPVAGRYLWGRTIGRAIYKLGWTTEVDSDYAALHTGVCDQILKTSLHVPILSDMAAAYVATRAGCRRRPYVDQHSLWGLSWGEGCTTQPYDESTLRAVAQIYGYSVERLKCTISLIRSQTVFPCVLNDAVLTGTVYQDEL